MTAGYSGTPLARKLSLRDGMRVWFDGMPGSVLGEIEAEALDLIRFPAPARGLDAAHIFVTDWHDMVNKLDVLRPLIDPAGFVWVSWPKRASKVATDLPKIESATPSADDGLGRRQGLLG